jgi:hypothetical protein
MTAVRKVLLSRHQNSERNHNVKTAKRSFEYVAQFKHVETIIANQNLIQEEIKRKLNSGNACDRSVQSLLFFPLLHKNVRMYRSIIFPLVLYGCET